MKLILNNEWFRIVVLFEIYVVGFLLQFPFPVENFTCIEASLMLSQKQLCLLLHNILGYQLHSDCSFVFSTQELESSAHVIDGFIEDTIVKKQ